MIDQLYLLLAEGAEPTVNYAQIVMEYIIYGSIFIIGLIVLIFMRRGDKRSKIEICVLKTDELLEDIAKINSENLAKDHLFFAKMNNVKVKMGDLVVILEKVVVENRNVNYDGVLGLYKQAMAKLDDENIVWNKNNVLAAIAFVQEKLQEGQKILKEVQ